MKYAAFLAFAFAVFAAPASAAETCHGVTMPPRSLQQEPTVYYELRWVSDAEMHRLVNAVPTPSGFSSPSPTEAHPDRWVILLNRHKIGLSDYDCVLRYEKSHLPPNNYPDSPSVQALFKPYM